MTMPSTGSRQREHFAVNVYRNGELVVTIETNSLSGRELIDGDEEVIETAAESLLGFIGKPELASLGGAETPQPPNVCEHWRHQRVNCDEFNALFRLNEQLRSLLRDALAILPDNDDGVELGDRIRAVFHQSEEAAGGSSATPPENDPVGGVVMTSGEGKPPQPSTVEAPARADEPLKAACLDCGLPYESFPLDMLLPRHQWLEIHPDDGGLLCARCIVARASKILGAVAIHAVIGIVPQRAASGVSGAASPKDETP